MSDQPQTPPNPGAENQPPPQDAPMPGHTQPLPGYMPGYVAPPPGYMPPPGYPYPGYPQQPMAYPPGYMPQGYPPGYAVPPGYPPGYAVPQGYPGQPMMPPGYAMPPHPSLTGPLPAPVAAPAVPTAEAAPAPSAIPAPTAVPAPVATPAPIPAPVVAGIPAPVAAIPAPVAAPVPVAAATPAVAPIEDGLPHPFHPEAAHDFGPAPQQNAFLAAWRKIGGGSLTFSLIIHGGLLLIAGLIVFTSTHITKNVDFLPGGGTAQGEKASADLQQKKQNKKRSTISKTTPMKKVVSNSATASISLPEAPPDILDTPDVSSMLGGGSLGGGGFGKGGNGGGFGTGMGMGSQAGFVSLPPTMRARCSTTERLEKLRQNGGSPECEAAVSRALEWLKTKQNKDGSWGQGAKAGMTGLALLCYLGRCETPESPFYGDNVMKGIMYLIELSKKNEYGFICENPKPISGAYEHGIATYALGEMYTLARLGSKSLPGMKDAFEKGVKLIIESQNESGGWDYYTKLVSEDGKKNSRRDDLSVVGWQFQALKAAKHTGLKIPGLHESITKALKYIETTQTKDGGFGGSKRDDHYNQWSLTGVGSLALQTMAKNKTASINKGIKFLRTFISAEPLDWNKNCNLYCWYYYTQTFFQKGGDDWKFYNEMLLPQLLNNQKPDGSWKPERANWDAGSAGEKYGGVYKTALCTLQLEVYYRYLKVADRDEDSFFDK